MKKLTPFHVAVPVYDLEESRKFYREVLGCGEGRSDTNWTDFDWHVLEKRLRDHQIKFIIEPYIRFKGMPGEQATMFFLDPSGNALEFKSFQDISQLFAT